MNNTIDLFDYFTNPATQRQKQYEAVRAVIIENQSIEGVAKKFNYKNCNYSASKKGRFYQDNESGLFYVSEQGINGLPLKASLIASKTFFAFLRAVEI